MFLNHASVFGGVLVVDMYL